MAPTKKRKTFKQRTDIDTEPSAGIDEQEQEQIIDSLAHQDASTTATYRKLFIAIALLATTFYLLTLLYVLLGLSPTSHSIQYALGTASLAVTTIIAHEIPAPKSPTASFLDTPLPKWPVLELARPFLTDLNAYLGGVGCVVAMSLGATSDYDLSAWIPAMPPVFIFGLVWLARRELRPIDVKSLQDLKYNFKGA